MLSGDPGLGDYQMGKGIFITPRVSQCSPSYRQWEGKGIGINRASAMCWAPDFSPNLKYPTLPSWQAYKTMCHHLSYFVAEELSSGEVGHMGQPGLVSSRPESSWFSFGSVSAAPAISAHSSTWGRQESKENGKNESMELGRAEFQVGLQPLATHNTSVSCIC